MRRRFAFWVAVVLALTFGSAGLQAQLTTATLSGTIKDQTGAVISGAEVTATNTGTNLSRTTISNDQGEYRIEFLPIGSYTVQFVAPGFNKYVQKGIVLEINQSGRLDATMQPGVVKEVLEVTSAAPLVNTNNAEIGQTVQNVQIQELPLVNRNVYTLLDITPGVQSNNTDGLTLGYPEQKTLINGGTDGQLNGSVNYFLDGGNNMTGLRNTGNVLPNPDAIQEFRVQTNAYSAEYGRFASGVINVVTKSGTNDFHGSAFEFWRNDALNAKPWGSAVGSGPLHRNQFGFTLGGPIKKNKTFFFGSYAGLRQTTSTFMHSAIVPTDLEREGDFRQSVDNQGKPIKLPTDPLTKQPFSCNGVVGVICPDRMDKVALNILNKYIPLPNVTGNLSNNYQAFQPNPYNTDDFLIKIDHQLTPNQQLSGSYFTTSGTNVVNGGSSNVPWSEQQYSWRQQNLNLSDTHTINASLVNQTWFVYSRMIGGRSNIPGISLADLGSTFSPQGSPSLPQISVTNYFTLGSAIAGPVAGTNLYSLRDVFSLAKGRHNLKFGGELSLEKDEQQTLLNNYGVFSFNTSITGNGLADFLIGVPNSVSQDSPVSPATNSWNTAVFVQDDFRIRPRLTLNMGLRWDVQPSPTDTADRQSTFIAGEQSVVRPYAPVGLVFPGDPGVPRGIVPTRWGHISPRFGFAYDPWGDGKTSIRGGAGIFWGSISANEWNGTSNYQPFSTRLTFTNAGSVNGATLADPYRNYVGGAPFPYNGQFTNGGSVQGIAPNFDSPYTYQMNLSVQRQITAATSASVAYVGSMSHNLPFAYDLNYPILDGSAGSVTSAAANVQSRRPDQAFGSITQVQSNETSSYHSLQITGNQRMSHNLNFTTSYVFAKMLCSSEVEGSTGGVAQDQWNMPVEHGRCDTDIRHMFNFALVFQPDYYHGENVIVRHIVNGWQLSPIVRLRSGSPFTVMNGLDANGDGKTNDRAQLIGDPHLDNPSAAMWFNTAAFSANPKANNSSIDGTSPRNFLDGPGSRVVDLAISRTFQLPERFKIEFRGEATNAFNIVSLSNPGTTVGNKGFGVITGAKAMRQVQLGLKLLF